MLFAARGVVIFAPAAGSRRDPKETLMSKHDSIGCNRRVLLAAGGAFFVLGAALRPTASRAEAAGRKIPIGTIGAGHIGGTIGGLWVKDGHSVFFSDRHPQQLNGLVATLGPLAHAGTVPQAIAFGEAILLTVPYGAIPQIGRDYAALLKGKIVLDTCNAVAARDGAIAEEVEKNGIGVTTQKYFPGARVVRAFNTMSYKYFEEQANRADPKLAVPIAGDDPEALRVAAQLVRDAGFDPVVVGKLADARLFQRGGPGYGQRVTAAELRQKLSLPQ
jgi:8-hydroxy-5-deazaflavin:NADPH oxidoreductase